MTYPHPLHPRHCPKRSQCSQRSHCFERLNSASPTQGGHKVNERNLVVRKTDTDRTRKSKIIVTQHRDICICIYIYLYLCKLYKYSISYLIEEMWIIILNLLTSVKRTDSLKKYAVAIAANLNQQQYSINVY